MLEKANAQHNDISQNSISIAQLAEWLTKDHPEQKEDVQLNLLARVHGGNFNFEAPGEIYHLSQPYITLKHGFKMGSLDVGDICFGIEDYIRARCNWSNKHKKSYGSVQYDHILSCLDAIDGKVPCDPSTRWEILYNHLIPTIGVSIYEGEVVRFEHNAITATTDFGIVDSEQKELVDLFKRETRAMELALTQYLYLEKEAILHWLRLEYHTEERSMDLKKKRCFFPIEYNGFLGDPWEGYPKPWNPKIDEEKGLILRDAFKYYSDPHEWAEYEEMKDRLGLIVRDLNKGIGLSLKDEKEKLSEEVTVARNSLIQRFLEHFSSNRLVAQGYIGKQTSEKITHSQLRDMVEGNQLDLENSNGRLGKAEITSIRVKKADVVDRKGTLSGEEIHPKERESMLKLIITMAIEKYRYDPDTKRNTATKNIQDALLKHGFFLDDQSILKYLREGAEILKESQKEQELA